MPVLAKEDPHRSALDLRPQQAAVWRPRPAGRGVFVFARSERRASRAAAGRLCRIDAGRRLCRVQPAHRLYEGGRKLGPIVEAACWTRARRKVIYLARLNKAPIATEAVARVDALFAVERDINGMTPQQRVAVRKRTEPAAHHRSGELAARVACTRLQERQYRQGVD